MPILFPKSVVVNLLKILHESDLFMYSAILRLKFSMFNQNIKHLLLDVKCSRQRSIIMNHQQLVFSGRDGKLDITGIIRYVWCDASLVDYIPFWIDNKYCQIWEGHGKVDWKCIPFNIGCRRWWYESAYSFCIPGTQGWNWIGKQKQWYQKASRKQGCFNERVHRKVILYAAI